MAEHGIVPGVRGLLLDLDGVMYVGDDRVPGADDTVRWLRTTGIPHLYLTNTTSRPRSSVIAKLGRLGIPTTPDDILTPCVAAAGWLRQNGLTRPALFVPAATAQDVGGLDTTSTVDAHDADAVVVGDLGEGWDFATLNRAFRLLMAAHHPPLVALGTTRYWNAPDGLRLDTGAFVAALATATGRDPVVLGKPAAAFYAAAVAQLGLPADQVAMVGDDIVTDVGGAQRAGLAGVLVRTGKYRPHDLEGDVRPDAVLDSIADLPDWWAGRSR